MTFIVREQQMAAFQNEKDRHFAEWMEPFLRDNYSDLVERLSSAAVMRLVMTGMGRARRWGITDPNAFTAFVILAIRYGSDFDEHPLVGKAMRSGAGSANLNGRILEALLSAEEWHQVANRAH